MQQSNFLKQPLPLLKRSQEEGAEGFPVGQAVGWELASCMRLLMYSAGHARHAVNEPSSPPDANQGGIERLIAFPRQRACDS